MYPRGKACTSHQEIETDTSTVTGARPGVFECQPFTIELIMSAVTGTVKWFNESKGYGFITQDSGSDIFAHFKAIVGGGGFKTLREGQRVRFNVTQGAKGPQAENIEVIN